MSLPVTVPNTFANSTVSIPLSNLDNNFTTITNSINGLTNGSSQINVASISATGTANSNTFLRGDGSWANVSTGGGGNGTVTSVNAATANGFSFTGGPITTSGTLTLTVPAPGTSGNVLTSNGSAWYSSAGAYPITSGTSVASTSGTSIDFTGIPSWVKRVTVIFNGVSTNGASQVLVQIGSGSVTTSGYTSLGGLGAIAGGVGGTTSTAGFVMGDNSASAVRYGTMIIVNITGTTWVSSHSIGSTGINYFDAGGGGSPSLSGALDRVRITTVNGTDTFDAGSINILYE